MDTLIRYDLNHATLKKMMKPIMKEIRISRQILQLNTMVKLLKYWHVAHLPFALIMLIIMVNHVAVTLAFGYKWIFNRQTMWLEELLIYGIVGIICLLIIFIYLRKIKKASVIIEGKIEQAKQDGVHEPVSLHPVIDPLKCIGRCACAHCE